MNDIPFIFLVILSAFSMNLVLQCALGVKGAAERENPGGLATLIKLGIIFIAVVLLWVFFSKIISSIISGIFIYVLLFPLGYMAYNGLEYLIFNFLLKRNSADSGSVSFPGGITAAAVFICLIVADSLIEVAALSFGFCAGIFLVYLITGEIRRRAALETVPTFLRGKPLVLVLMGMLSFVFSTASLLLFRMIGAR